MAGAQLTQSLNVDFQISKCSHGKVWNTRKAFPSHGQLLKHKGHLLLSSVWVMPLQQLFLSGTGVKKKGANMLPGAFLPLILLHWVIFKTSFSKHLLSVVHWELLFHMLCLYCGCGRNGAEPACFQGASGSNVVQHAKFKISNKFNMYSAGIRCLL